MLRVEPLNHQAPKVAEAIFALLDLAHTQESELLGIKGMSKLERSSDLIRTSTEFFLGAWRENELIGTLVLGPDSEPKQLHIATLVVHPDHQRQGIGRLLLLEILRRASGMVVSVSSGAANVRALSLYASLGFVVYRTGIMGNSETPVVKLRNAP